ADDDLPRLIAAHVGDVEDADELLVADEAEEQDAVEDLELEVDLLRDLVDAAAALGHADDDRGDVVLAAPLVGERDEARGELPLGDLFEETAELVLLEVAVESVGAEQEAIARQDVEVEDVRVDVAVDADGACDRVLVLD